MFKAGPQLDSEGDYKVFSVGDLDDVVKTYNPKKHEAPLIVGHEQTDSTPSLGWVQKIWRDGNSLMGSIELTPRAEKLIREGTFKKVSSSFYTPDAPTNPVPGKMSLRHLALVSIPAVKGLSDFSEELKHFINITSNFSENLIKDTTDTNSKNMRRRRKSVADHAEGLNVTINIASDEKKVPTYDNTGTQIGPDGSVSDYMDTKDSFADEPDLPPLPGMDEDPDSDPAADPADPLAAEDTSGSTDDIDENLDSDTEAEDISGDMEDEDDEIAELAANYTHKQLYDALQLQKEAKASLGGPSDFSEYDKQPFKKENPDDEDVDEEATKEFAAECSAEDTKEYADKPDDDDADDPEGEGKSDISSLKERVQQLEEELMKQKRMAREKEVSDFCEALYSQGKLTEKIVNRTDLSKFLVTLNSKNAVNFSEGGKQSQFKFMKSLLKKLPGVVSFKEVATPKTAPAQAKAMKPEADGYSYDNQSMDTHKKALSYAETHGVDYVTALKTILD